MKIEIMKYSQYKKHYADCQTVPGTYSEIYKTIKVIIPDGRMKASGVRGQRFHGYELYMLNENNEVKRCCYRAVSEENAMKQHIKCCKANGWTPCEPPEGKIARIYM